MKPKLNCIKLIIAGLFFTFSISNAQPLNLAWAQSFSGQGNCRPNDQCLDLAGNIYSVGTFSGTFDFDPGPAVNNHSATTQEAYITKMNSSGNLLLFKKLSGSLEVKAIITDILGNIFIVGDFSSTVDFDPGPNSFTVTAAGPSVFVLKLNMVGDFSWVKIVGGSNALAKSNAIELDQSENIIVAGSFNNTIDADPGAGVYNLVGGSTSKLMILKLDSSGNFLWANAVDANLSSGPNGLAIDLNGDILTTGFFMNTVDFDPGPNVNNLTSNGGQDIFILKIGFWGNFLWAKNMGGTLNDLAKCIATDHSGNIYTSGSFYGTADFDPTNASFNLNSLGNKDIFISKLDILGNFIFAKSVGGTGIDQGDAIDIGIDKNIYLTGVFQGTSDFDPAASMVNLSSSAPSVYDTFICTYDSLGNFIFGGNIGSDSNLGVFSIGITTGYSSEAYITGQFSGTADLDPSINSSSLTIAGSSINTFIIKLANSTVGVADRVNENDKLILHPNPAKNYTKIESATIDSEIIIRNIFGSEQKIISSNLNGTVEVDISELTGGVYFLTINQKGKSKTFKLIKE